MIDLTIKWSIILINLLEKIMTTITTVADFIKEKLVELFPDSGVSVKVVNILSTDVIIVTYTHFTDASKWSSGHILNDPNYMRLGIDNQLGRIVCEASIVNNRAVTFRKINGKTFDEVAQKLVNWFAKNQKEIQKLPE